MKGVQMINYPPTVLFKQGVCGELRPEAQKGFGRVARLFLENDLDFIVTSIREGNHMPGSLHYVGMAFDFRKGIFKKADIMSVLNADWDVVEHETSFHCELDRKIELPF
jgi:hypothetical protein